jgi:ABC-2 type transport system permease protein
MHNIFLIAKREYLERVRSRSFLIMTIFIPALMFAVTVLPTMMSLRMSSGKKHVVVVASDMHMAELIRQELTKPPEQSSQSDALEAKKPAGPKYEVETETDLSDAQRAGLTEKVKQKQLDGVVWAPDAALAAKKVTYVTRDVSSLIDREVVKESVSDAVRRRMLLQKGLSDSEIAGAFESVHMETVNPSGTGPSNPMTTFFAVLAMVMILYVTVLLYGINVMRAVLEEKTSRIMEVMLSTATAKEMMAGKILGVGAVGLTQIGIWAATTGLLSGGVGLAASGMLKGVVSWRVGLFFPVFFLLGFALFSTMYAAIGAMVNSEQEAQQLQFLVAMPLIASVIILVQILENPGTPMALWASIFPLTSPLIMFTRIALDSQVPGWQIAVSIGLLIATIYGTLLLCGRIYRVGILMYGKKPTLPEIVKWIKYA